MSGDNEGGVIGVEVLDMQRDCVFIAAGVAAPWAYHVVRHVGERERAAGGETKLVGGMVRSTQDVSVARSVVNRHAFAVHQW